MYLFVYSFHSYLWVLKLITGCRKWQMRIWVTSTNLLVYIRWWFIQGECDGFIRIRHSANHKKAYRFLLKSFKERDDSSDLGASGRAVLRGISENSVWVLDLDCSDSDYCPVMGFCQHGEESKSFVNGRIYCTAEQRWLINGFCKWKNFLYSRTKLINQWVL